jgi:RNA polymerase sigma factor (sigma-70 family)
LDERTDNDLVLASCQGDRTAYAGLVGRHYRQTFLVCLGVLGNVHDAEDAAQDAMIQGFQRIRQLRRGSRFGPWVMAIARNLSVNLLRKRKAMQKAVAGWSPEPGAARVAGILPARSEDVPPSDHGRDAGDTRGQGVPSAAFCIGESHDALDTGASEDLRQAVAGLPWDLRLPLVMHYFGGYDVKAVAEKLDMSTSGVYLKLRNAIKELQEILAAQGDTP